jgi:death on curing protein
MTQPVWLTVDIIKTIQADLIQRFGGKPGLRDEALLESIIKRAQLRWTEGTLDIRELAACYAYGLAESQAFVDGNLRIAFAVADVFLRLNNEQIDVSEPKIVLTFLDLAAGDLDEKALAKAIST